MNINEHLQSRINLLNDYSLCLERENESKSKEIATLHNHLQVLSRENDELRTIISELRNKIQEKEQQTPSSIQPMQEGQQCEELQSKKVFADSECQTDDDCDSMKNLKNQLQALKDAIRQKEARILNYQSECEQMYEGIEKLEKCLVEQQNQHRNDLATLKKLEDKLRVQEKRRRAAEQRYEDVNQTIASVDQENQAVRQHIFELEAKIDELVMQNNRLIQQTCELEKEKYDYYNQLKRGSRLSFGTVNLGNSSLKRANKVKDQRWREIEVNLRRLQQENEALSSNLMLNR